MLTDRVKAGDVLKMLCSHPEVLRRKALYLEAAELAKSRKAKVAINGIGWSVYKPNAIAGEETITMGLWTSLIEKLDLLEDIHFKIGEHNGKDSRFNNELHI